MAILTTLHQPRASIMSQFEHLMILSAGRQVFYGTTENYIPYLEHELRVDVPKHESPYDLLLDLLNPAVTAQGSGSIRSIIRSLPSGCEDVSEGLAGIFAGSPLKGEMDKRAEQHKEISKTASMQEIFAGSTERIGWCSQFLTL